MKIFQPIKLGFIFGEVSQFDPSLAGLELVALSSKQSKCATHHRSGSGAAHYERPMVGSNLGADAKNFR